MLYNTYLCTNAEAALYLLFYSHSIRMLKIYIHSLPLCNVTEESIGHRDIRVDPFLPFATDAYGPEPTCEF